MRYDRLVAATLATVAALLGVAGAAHADGAKVIVIGGKADDPFWSIVKRGAEDAGKVVSAQGGSVTWLAPRPYDNLGPDAAKLIQTALSQHPAAIVGPDWVAAAEDDAFKQVVAAGVPLVIYNSGGQEAADRLGAKNYIGSDEVVAGTAGGEYFATHGVKSALCVNTIPGSANQEARCKGVSDGMAKHGAKGTELPLPSSSFGNPTAVAQAIKAALLKDSSIDGVVTISAGAANSAATGITQAGLSARVKLGTFDMDQATLDRIKGGSQLYAIDQQPYMQGYLAVSLVNALANYGMSVPTRPILTGPAIVDSSNVDSTLAGVKAGTR